MSIRTRRLDRLAHVLFAIRDLAVLYGAIALGIWVSHTLGIIH